MSAPVGKQWVSDLWKRSRGAYIRVVCAAMFINLMAIAPPVYVLQVYDRVVFQGGLSTLQALVIGMLIVVVFDYILKFMKAQIFSRISLNIDLILNRMVYEHFNGMPLKILESKPTSYWQQLFQDIAVVRNMYAGSQAALVIDLPFSLLFMAIIAYISLPLFVVILVFACCFVLLALVSSLVMRRKARNLEQAQIDSASMIGELIQSRVTLKALGLRDLMQWRFEGHQAELIDKTMKRGGGSDSFQILSTSLTMLSTVVVTAVGALLILQQELTIGALIASNMLSSRMIGLLAQIVSQWPNVFAARKAKQRLGEFFACETEAFDTDIAFPVPTQSYVLNDIQYMYDPDAPVPAAVSIKQLKLPARGLVVVMGHNGSGKTTFMKMLTGLYPPTKGQITLGGGDILQYARRQLVEWIGYQPQEIVLFSGTVFENIAMGALNQSKVLDHEVLAAARATGLNESIPLHPDGYMRQLGEGGCELSGGQRQRVCLARALIGNRRVLLLDEPTSHLDQGASAQIARVLKEHARENLVVVISHQPKLRDTADYLVIFERGQIVSAGERSQVLASLRNMTKASVTPPRKASS